MSSVSGKDRRVSEEWSRDQFQFIIWCMSRGSILVLATLLGLPVKALFGDAAGAVVFIVALFAFMAFSAIAIGRFVDLYLFRWRREKRENDSNCPPE